MKQDSRDNRARVDRAWDKMDLLLDQNFSKKEKERKFFFLWFLLGILMLAAVGYIGFIDTSSEHHIKESIEQANTQGIVSNLKLEVEPAELQNSANIETEENIEKQAQLPKANTKLNKEPTASSRISNNETPDFANKTILINSTNSSTVSSAKVSKITKSKESTPVNYYAASRIKKSKNEIGSITEKNQIGNIGLLGRLNSSLVYNDLRNLNLQEPSSTEFFSLEALVVNKINKESGIAIAMQFERMPDLEANGTGLNFSKTWGSQTFGIRPSLGVSYFRPSYFKKNVIVDVDGDLKVSDPQDPDLSNSAEDVMAGAGIGEMNAQIALDKNSLWNINLSLAALYNLNKSQFSFGLGLDYFTSKQSDVVYANQANLTSSFNLENYFNEDKLIPFAEIAYAYKVSSKFNLYASYKHDFKNVFELGESKLSGSRIGAGISFQL